MTGERPLALVTGASSGIGLELARQFAEHGFDLLLAAEDGNLQQAASELSRTGAQIESVTVDLTQPEAVRGSMSVCARPGGRSRRRR